MNQLQEIIPRYLEFCRTQKRLDEKTLKAYRIDLRQFAEYVSVDRSLEVSEISREVLECYIAMMHREYKPKTVKRKLASLKALFVQHLLINHLLCRCVHSCFSLQ